MTAPYQVDFFLLPARILPIAPADLVPALLKKKKRGKKHYEAHVPVACTVYLQDLDLDRGPR